MKQFRLLLALGCAALFAALAMPMTAQAASINGMEQVYVCDPTINRGLNCIKPVLTAVAGAQVGLTISSATALTVPAGANIALIQAQGSNNTSGVCLNWRDDGTSPTTSAGMQMAALGNMYYEVGNLPIKLIAASGATCTATIFYYQ